MGDAGHGPEAGDSQQPQGTQRPKERDDKHEQVEQVGPDEAPSSRRQVEAGDVVDREGRPDRDVGDGEGRALGRR